MGIQDMRGGHQSDRHATVTWHPNSFSLFFLPSYIFIFWLLQNFFWISSAYRAVMFVFFLKGNATDFSKKKYNASTASDGGSCHYHS